MLSKKKENIAKNWNQYIELKRWKQRLIMFDIKNTFNKLVETL